MAIVYNHGWTDGLNWGGGIAIYSSEIETVTVRTNLVSQNLYFQLGVAPGALTATLTIDHNLIDGYRDHKSEGETRGAEYVEGDPLFFNGAGADFHLQAASPAIDAGSADRAPADDFDGRARPLDGHGGSTAAFDIVAFEMPYLSARGLLPIVRLGP